MRAAQGMELVTPARSAASWGVQMTEPALMDLASAANVSDVAFKVS